MSLAVPKLSPVVRKVSGPDRPTLSDDLPVDPLFGDDGDNSLTGSAPPAGFDAMLSHLGDRIHGSPRDLRLHVRRVLLAYRSGRSGAVCAALVDLFCALGDKGLDLRQTLLQRVSDGLTPGQQAALREILVRAPTVDECAATQGTRLSPPALVSPVIRRHERPDASASAEDGDGHAT